MGEKLGNRQRAASLMKPSFRARTLKRSIALETVQLSHSLSFSSTADVRTDGSVIANWTRFWPFQRHNSSLGLSQSFTFPRYDDSNPAPHTRRLVFLHKNAGRLAIPRRASVSMRVASLTIFEQARRAHHLERIDSGQRHDWLQPFDANATVLRSSGRVDRKAAVLPDSAVTEVNGRLGAKQQTGAPYHEESSKMPGLVTIMKEIRILLADDHTVMRRGLRLLLENQPEFNVVAEAADGRQAIEQAEATEPDVAVLDIAMPNLSGIEAAQRIAAALPGISIVILSMHSDEGYVLRALKAGAKGYLLKDSVEGDLIEAIQAVYQGKTFFSPEITKMLMEDYVREIRTRGSDDSYDLLTSREREILQLLVELKSNKEIAQVLNLSLYTVETHRRNLHEKLNLHSLPELILYAVRKGVAS